MPKRASRTSAAKCWRRYSDVTDRQKTRRHARRRLGDGEGTLTVKGPKGTLTMAMLDDRHLQRSSDGEISVKPVGPTRSAPRRLGPAADHGPEPRHRRHRGLHQGARNHRRRLSRRGPGQELAPATGLQPRRQLPGSRRIEIKTPDANTVEISGIDSSRSARSRPKSAAGASPNLTRARASSIAANISTAKKARRSKPWPNFSVRSAPAPGSHRALAQHASGKPRLSVHRSGAAYLRPGHRRCRRQDAGRRFDPRQDCKRGKIAATREGAAAVGKTLAERAKKAGVSAASCSIAAASCFMAG